MIAMSEDDDDDDGDGTTGKEIDDDGDGATGDGATGYDDNDDDGGEVDRVSAARKEPRRQWEGLYWRYPA